jgi:geranylgeranyl pyrophosphate synthase
MSFFQLPSFLLKKRSTDLALKEFVENIKDNTSLKEAIDYSIFNGGKRIRPIIVLMLQEALNCPYSIMDAALSIELFHTASLIADDLPMMDNDATRRDKPSTHIKFGETTALLASYGLILLSLIFLFGYQVYNIKKTLISKQITTISGQDNAATLSKQKSNALLASAVIQENSKKI